MFVNEHTPFGGFLTLNLFQHAFALEHHRQHVTGVARGIFGTRQSAKKILGRFFPEGFGRLHRGRFEARLPKRKRTNIFISAAPSFFAEIFASKSVPSRKSKV